MLGAGRLSGARHILLPAALPGYLAGLKQGWAFSWRSLMAAELIANSPQLGQGLGQYLENGRSLSDMPTVMAAIILILFVGIGIDAAGVPAAGAARAALAWPDGDRVMGSPLIAVAHGSRDPRSAATVHALLDVVRALAPVPDVRAAFLDLSAPRLPDVLAAVHAEGHDEAVVVPLLLGSAYHARVDIPGAVARAVRRFPRLTVRVADVLGPDRAAGVRGVAQAGRRGRRSGGHRSGRGAGRRRFVARARQRRPRAGGRGGWNRRAVAAFAAAADPDVPTAIAALRARGARRIAVGSWFLAPGLLPDRVARLALAADPTALVAGPFGADPEVADVVLSRYAEAKSGTVRRAS